MSIQNATRKMRNVFVAAMVTTTVIGTSFMSQNARAEVATAVVAAVATTAALKAIEKCEVVWKVTDIKVFGRKVGKTHLPQYHCNPKN